IENTTLEVEHVNTPELLTPYTFPPSTTPFSSVSFTTKVDTDPGPTAKIRWSHSFSFADKGPIGSPGHTYNVSGVAHTGMEANGNKRSFFFTAWDSNEAMAGAPGSSCAPLEPDPSDREATGMTCRMAVDWVAGHTYRSDVKHEGDRWFSVTVTDEVTSESFDLGRIRARDTKADAISPHGMSDVTTYLEGTCDSHPQSSVTFNRPLGSSDGGASVP
ncbi:hypothetical protein, partial [Luethyella okanaganae]